MPSVSTITMAWIAASVLWAVVVLWWITKHRSASLTAQTIQSVGRRTFLSALAVLMLLVGATSLVETDVLSDDVYRYQWDGWLVSNGLDPYAGTPISPEFDQFKTSSETKDFPADVPYNYMPTIYPPGAQILFGAVASTADVSYQGWKYAWTAFTLACFMVLLYSLRANSEEFTLATAVVFSPLLLFHGYLDIHLDILVGGLIALGFAAFYKKHFITVGLILGLGATVKYLPIVALFFMLFGRSPRERLQMVGGALAIVAVVYAPYLTSDLSGNLATYVTAWKANAGIFELINMLISDGEATRLVLAALGLSVGVLIWVRWRRDAATATALILIAMLLCSPVVHAWYLIPAAFLIPFAPLRSTIVWMITICVYGLFVAEYRSGGGWTESPALLTVEYLPVVVAYVFDLIYGPIKLTQRVRDLTY